MRKVALLTILSIATVVLVSVAHYYDHMHWGLGWTRILLAVPVIYAGVNFRRSGAISIAMLMIIAQGPLIIIKYSQHATYDKNHIISVMLISVVSVMFGHVLRKERENSDSLEYIHGLIKSTRGDIEEDRLFATLENAFAQRCQTSEVATYLFGDDRALRPRANPGAAPLPPGHLFYTVAQTREFLVSSNPAQDSRLIYYGPGDKLFAVSHLAVFPIEYGGSVRGVISMANTADEHFGKETISLLTAIKKSVENTLDLSEKLRGRIHHEMQKIKIRDTFSSYLSRTVAEQILTHPESLDLGGEIRGVTIMFTEVTNFRHLMKTVPPEEILSRLNELFSAAIDTIFEFDGTLDKFIGDNVMAFWGAPLADPDCERKAVACALKLHKKIQSLNAEWERRGDLPFNVCIGINSGSAVAGNIGSIRRMEYTVIGDNVNLASRIKSLSCRDNIPILVSESTHAKTHSEFPYSEPFQAAVKGKTRTITVYRVLIPGQA